MTPDPNGQHDRRGQQQRSYRNVNHRRDDHRQLRLRRITSPHHTSYKRQKAEAELSHHQAQHSDRRTTYGFDMRIDSDGANGRPRKNDRHNASVNDVRPPTQTMMTEHGSK